MPNAQAAELFISLWEVKINGTAILEVHNDLVRLEVDRAVFMPGMATIELYDPDMKWADDTRFAIGTTLVLNVKPAQSGTAAVELFNGEITALELIARSGEDVSTFIVRAFDKSHRLQRSRKAAVFSQQTDSDVISALISGGGLTATVDATSEVRDHVLQDTLTDYDFICRLARRNGMIVTSKAGTLEVKKPVYSGAAIELKFRETLVEFQPVLASTAQVASVTAKGWDPKTKAAVMGKASSGDSGAQQTGFGRTGAALSATFGTADALVTDVPIALQAEGDAIAASLLADRWRRDVRGEGIAIGNPNIVPGSILNLQFIGTRFGGKYFATRVRHVYTADYYQTHFSITGLEPETAADLIVGNSHDQRSGGAGGGVAIGIVTNVEDPEGMGRVKLKFPWMDDNLEMWWARMATPMAGAKRGIQFMPEVNDEVLVAFDRGDRSQPYILGGLWNGQDAPPMSPSEFFKGGAIIRQQIKTTSGHLLEFSEAQGEEHFSVTTAKKNTLNLDDGAKKVLVQSAGGHMVEINDNGSGKITIKTSGDVMVEASGKVTVKATMDAAVEGMNVTVKASGNLDLSGANVTVKASAMLDMSSTGVTLLKGSLVKIN